MKASGWNTSASQQSTNWNLQKSTMPFTHCIKRIGNWRLISAELRQLKMRQLVGGSAQGFQNHHNFLVKDQVAKAEEVSHMDLYQEFEALKSRIKLQNALFASMQHEILLDLPSFHSGGLLTDALSPAPYNPEWQGPKAQDVLINLVINKIIQTQDAQGQIDQQDVTKPVTKPGCN